MATEKIRNLTIIEDILDPNTVDFVEEKWLSFLNDKAKKVFSDLASEDALLSSESDLDKPSLIEVIAMDYKWEYPEDDLKDSYEDYKIEVKKAKITVTFSNFNVDLARKTLQKKKYQSIKSDVNGWGELSLTFDSENLNLNSGELRHFCHLLD